MTRNKKWEQQWEEAKASPQGQAQGRKHAENTMEALRKAFFYLHEAERCIAKATEYGSAAQAVLDLPRADVNIKGLCSMSDNLKLKQRLLKMRIVRLKVVTELKDMSEEIIKEMTDEA